MMIRRRGVAILSAFLALTMALAGCGAKETKTTTTPAATPAPSAAPAAPKAPVTIEFWHAFGGAAAEIMNALADKFNKSQTEVIVKAVYQGDYFTNHQKVSAAIAAKTPPPVTVIEVASLPFFADNGALADMGAISNNDPIFKDFLPGLMREAVWKGKTLSAPFARSTPILYLNVNLLKEAGLNPAGPKNWDELRDYAIKLTKRDATGKVERWGFLTPVDVFFFEAMVFQQGGTFFSPDNKTVTFNGQAGIDSLNFWVSLVHQDKVMEMPQGDKFNAWDVSSNAFNNGQAAMIFSTSSRLVTHLKGAKGFEVGTAFLPAGPKGYGTPTGGSNLVILAGAPKEQQEAAWKFIKFATSAEQSIDVSKAAGTIPTSNAAIKLMADYFKQYPQGETTIKQLEFAQPRPQHPAYGLAQETIVKALQKAVLGAATPKQALDEAAAEIAKQLK